MKDLANSVVAVQSLAPANRTGDANGTGVDLQGFESATAVFDVGAEGDTLSASVKIEGQLEHSDDNTNFSAVPTSQVTDGSTNATGVFVTYDANAEVPAVASIGYVGGKRYLRVVDQRTGTQSSGTPSSAMIIKGNPRHSQDANNT